MLSAGGEQLCAPRASGDTPPRGSGALEEQVSLALRHSRNILSAKDLLVSKLPWLWDEEAPIGF